ncbi:MAG: hypothetical protein JWP87_6191 [Labilithrix sp.]|nr:hypothetical protein [Labilithrix sp.]
MGAVLVVVAGCEPAAKRAIEESRADVQAQLARAQKIGTALASVPPVTKEGLTMAGPVVLAANHKDELPTATLVYAEDLPALTAPVLENDRLSGAKLLSECASLLTQGQHLGTSTTIHANVVKSYLAKCKNLKHVFVIRTRKKAARELTGDVVAFELASGKYEGGFPLAITSAGRTDKVSNTTTSTTRSGVGRRARATKTVTTTESSVNADESQLRSDLDDAIEDGITRLVPTAKFID